MIGAPLTPVGARRHKSDSELFPRVRELDGGVELRQEVDAMGVDLTEDHVLGFRSAAVLPGARKIEKMFVTSSNKSSPTNPLFFPVPPVELNW